jgi:hypothetical protein
MSEVDLNVPGRERTHDQRRQKRPDPHRGGDAESLEDVERQVHGALP